MTYIILYNITYQHIERVKFRKEFFGITMCGTTQRGMRNEVKKNGDNMVQTFDSLHECSPEEDCLKFR